MFLFFVDEGLFTLLTDNPSDFADDIPEAEVIGTDISPIQPTWIPPNLKL